MWHCSCCPGGIGTFDIGFLVHPPVVAGRRQEREQMRQVLPEEEHMATAQVGDTVKVHYTGTLADATVFDSSRGRAPLEFTIGAGQIIPGFEQAVVGMQPGQTITTTIPADQAYGPHDPDLVVAVDRAQFGPEFQPAVGQQYQIRQPNGQAAVVTVTDVSPTEVTLDANHPLAGQDLTFDIELIEIVS
jgi:FKBP-type peptidyl-prolyl cis-trans isomerase 2